MSLYLHFLVSPSEESECFASAFLGAKYTTTSAVSVFLKVLSYTKK